jgi:hypothetical protein
MKMWILLMIIFSQPYQVSEIQILGTYIQKPACEKEIRRALSIRGAYKKQFWLYKN